MNILVTGCAGFIGSHFCEFLIKNNHTVCGIDNMNQFYDPEIKKQNLMDVENTAAKLGKDFVFYHTDIRHERDVADILKDNKVDLIVHLAAMAGVRPSLENPLLYIDVNEMGTLNLLNQAKIAGIKKFVFASSSSVYGNNPKVPFCETDNVDHPISTYAATKKAGELHCSMYSQLYDFRIACLRFFTVYGPRQRPDLAINKFTNLILSGKKIPVYGDGSKSRDFTFIEDIIDGVYKSALWVDAQNKGVCEIFNLGESETTDVNTLIAKLKAVLNKPADIQHLPDAPGDVQTTFANISKAKEMLGYAPTTKISEGLKKYADWVLKHKTQGHAA